MDTSKVRCQSYPPRAAAPDTFSVTYEDRTTIEVATQELRNTIDIRALPEWTSSRAHLQKAFEYLESRLTDHCEAPYKLAALYDVCEVVRAFDPTFINTGTVNAAYISDRLCVLPWLDVVTLRKLVAELPDYMVAARACKVSHRNVADFTAAVLEFWRSAPDKISTWQFEARRAFCLTPSSGASERVFVRLKAMFGETQTQSLNDYLEGLLMLAINEREMS